LIKPGSSGAVAQRFADGRTGQARPRPPHPTTAEVSRQRSGKNKKPANGANRRGRTKPKMTRP